MTRLVLFSSGFMRHENAAVCLRSQNVRCVLLSAIVWPPTFDLTVDGALCTNKLLSIFAIHLMSMEQHSVLLPPPYPSTPVASFYVPPPLIYFLIPELDIQTHPSSPCFGTTRPVPLLLSSQRYHTPTSPSNCSRHPPDLGFSIYFPSTLFPARPS